MECALELFAGNTYVVYTDCGSVKGDTQLGLLAPDSAPVAFNDGFPFCPGDTSASLIEYQMPCGLYGASAKFTLQQSCFEDTACSGSVVVEYSSKEPAVDCGRGPFVCAKQDAACEALGDLFYATNGTGWVDNDGWVDAAAGKAMDYCSVFNGVECDNAGVVPTSLCVRERAHEPPSEFSAEPRCPSQDPSIQPAHRHHPGQYRQLDAAGAAVRARARAGRRVEACF